MSSQTSPATAKKLIIIDGHALIYRSYFAFPHLTDPSGRLINAVFGFTKGILTAMRDFEPSHILVAFDHPQKTKRAEEYEAYKANREEMPDDLKPQIEIVKQIVEILNIPQFEMAGYEADDLIGTLVRQAEQQGFESLIVTGDKDLFQLVNDDTHVWIPGRGKGSHDAEYDPAAVEAKMGVTPAQIVDLKALMGDASDNIPGVKGIGAKTAVRLLQEFQTLESLYQALDEDHHFFKKAEKTKLSKDKQLAFTSQSLATILVDAPVELKADACKVSGYNRQEAAELFEELGFKSLPKLLPPDEFELELQDVLF